MRKLIAVLAVTACTALAAGQDPPLVQAYAALREKSYDAAVQLFRRELSDHAGTPQIHKDLAYTLLKIGENEAARDHFAEAFRIDPADTTAALEYAFLCNETRQQGTARHVFDRLRKTGNKTAEQAFENIDRPLAEGIDQWKRALELSPNNFSAHEELARLAENRDDLKLAADQYNKAWQLRPELRGLLIDLGRVWSAQDRIEEAHSAWLSASRAPDPRTAENARALLPSRYPYVYEFQNALKLDPSNARLHRELAYLHLEMGNKADAEREFKIIAAAAPDDMLSLAQLGFLLLARDDVSGAKALLERVLKSNDPVLAGRVREALRVPQELRKRAVSEKKAEPTPAVATGNDAKSLGERSLRAGYLQDALKYLTIAHENNPADYSIMLKLGWTNNMLHDDKAALEWFNLARSSPDALVAGEAADAYRNLHPEQPRFRTTVWTFPFYSSRWKDVFSYGQAKTEVRLGSAPVRAYLSARFIGDTRNTVGSGGAIAQPQYLSESSVIIGVGLVTNTYKGLTAWAEAGEAIRYRKRNDVGRMVPDYRGGIIFARTLGHNLGSEKTGLFFETANDGIFLSRYQNDVLLYSQNHTGVTLGRLPVQFYWNTNLTLDTKSQYWANFYEQGPGVKFRIPGMPRGLSFTVNGVRGKYLVNEGNPRGPLFYDLRAGLWYAFTH